MSSLTSFNSSGSMPFLVLTAVFLFIGPVLFIGIAIMWSNLKKFLDLDTKNNTSEIKKTFIEMNKRLSVEVNTKITNELSACSFEVSSFFTAELGRINTELNNKHRRNQKI